MDVSENGGIGGNGNSALPQGGGVPWSVAGGQSGPIGDRAPCPLLARAADELSEAQPIWVNTVACPAGTYGPAARWRTAKEFPCQAYRNVPHNIIVRTQCIKVPHDPIGNPVSNPTHQSSTFPKIFLPSPLLLTATFHCRLRAFRAKN